MLHIDNIEYGYALRKAFLQSIEVLGDSGRWVLIRNLARYDVDIDSPNLSIDDLRICLIQIIGQAPADLIMQLVFSKLDRMLDYGFKKNQMVFENASRVAKVDDYN